VLPAYGLHVFDGTPQAQAHQPLSWGVLHTDDLLCCYVANTGGRCMNSA
jgi:hypothetical protein